MANFLTYFKSQTIDIPGIPTLDDGDGDSLSNDLQLESGENVLVLIVTEQQYSQLLSSAFNGVITTYPEDYINVIYPLIKAGKVMLCDAIIDCINDSESGVMDAINNLLPTSSEQGGRDNGQSQSEFELGGGNNPTCDLDAWWAGCLQLVQYLNRVNEDALEIFEASSNVFELFAEVVGDITGIDETSIDAALEWIEFMQNSIIDDYLSQYTSEYEEEVACDLFCLAITNCKLTPTLIFDYFRDRLSGSVTYDSLINSMLQFIFTGSWSGTQIVDAFMCSQIFFRAGLGVFFGRVAWNDIDLRVRLGFNDANNDWETLCDECQWTSTLDFTVDDYGFVFEDADSGVRGHWVEGTGLVWSDVEVSGQERRTLQGYIPFDESNVTERRFSGSYTRGTDGGFTVALAIRFQLDGTPVGVTTSRTRSLFSPGTPTPFDEGVDELDLIANQCWLTIAPSYTDYSGGGYVSGCVISGVGTKPSQLP